MERSKLTVTGFECPLLMRIKISQSDIVMNCVIHQSVSVNADLDIHLLVRFLYNICLTWNIILFHDIQCSQFFHGQQVVNILSNQQQHTLVRSFFRSRMASSDLLVEPNTFLFGNSGSVRWSFNFEMRCSNSSWISLNSL